MLTFDKIRDLERKEKDSKQLQNLPPNFMNELREYIQRRKKIKEKSDLDLLEMRNVNETIKRLFEVREKKILELAIYSSRTGNPAENLIPSEEKFFSSLMVEIKSFKSVLKRELDDSTEEQEKDKKIVYRVKKSLPNFVGPDMKIYKLNENDIVDLPGEVKSILLKQGVLERVEE